MNTQVIDLWLQSGSLIGDKRIYENIANQCNLTSYYVRRQIMSYVKATGAPVNKVKSPNLGSHYSHRANRLTKEEIDYLHSLGPIGPAECKELAERMGRSASNIYAHTHNVEYKYHARKTKANTMRISTITQCNAYLRLVYNQYYDSDDEEAEKLKQKIAQLNELKEKLIDEAHPNYYEFISAHAESEPQD